MAAAHQDADRWCREVAGQRIPGTPRQRPLELFEADERPQSRPLPATPWELAVWTTAKVAPDACCQVRGPLDSVPWKYRGRRLEVRYTAHQVAFYGQGERVKTHRRGAPGQRLVDPADLPADTLAFSMRTPTWCRDRAHQLGAAVGRVGETLLTVNTLTHLRQAQGILRPADTYGAARLDAACDRAGSYGDPRYRSVRRILEQALDQQAVPPTPPAAGAGAYLHGPDPLSIAATGPDPAHPSRDPERAMD